MSDVCLTIHSNKLVERQLLGLNIVNEGSPLY